MWKFLLVLLITISSCISGCGREEDAAIEITMVHGWGGTFQSHEVMREIYAEFEQENPDIKMRYISYSDSSIAVEQAKDMLAVGTIPDIVSTNGFSGYVEYASKAGVLMNLMPYIEDDVEWKAQIHPEVFSAWVSEQKELYTIPDVLEVSGYWYNEAYLEKAGIESIPATWMEFVEMVEHLHKETTVFALEEDQKMNSLFWALLAGGMEGDLSSELNLAALQEAQDRLTELMRYADEAENIEEARERFANGETALFFSGVWEADELEKGKQSEYLKFANYPTYDGKSLSFVSASSGYAVAKQIDPRKQDACLRFLKYMSREDVQKKIAFQSCQVPVNPRIQVEEIQEHQKLFGEALQTALSADIKIPTMESIWNTAQKEWLETLSEEY